MLSDKAATINPLNCFNIVFIVCTFHTTWLVGKLNTKFVVLMTAEWKTFLKTHFVSVILKCLSFILQFPRIQASKGKHNESDKIVYYSFSAGFYLSPLLWLKLKRKLTLFMELAISHFSVSLFLISPFFLFFLFSYNEVLSFWLDSDGVFLCLGK